MAQKGSLGSSSGEGAGAVKGNSLAPTAHSPSPGVSVGGPKGPHGRSTVGGELRGWGVKRERESGDAGSPERPPGTWDLNRGGSSPTEPKEIRIFEVALETTAIVVISRNPAEDLPRTPRTLKQLAQKKV